MRYKRTASTSVLVLLAAAYSALPLLACECRLLTICELIQQRTVFVGEVIDGGITSIREDPWYASVYHVRFKVIENYRGLPRGTQTVDLDLLPLGGMCAPIPYHLGKRYLVAPSKRDGLFSDGPCFQGRDVEKFAELVSQVRDYFKGKMPINVQGKVAAARDSSLVDFPLQSGEAKPLVGVTISTSREREAYSTMTRADGRYTLAVPDSGVYEICASLGPYSSEPVQVTVPNRGCAIQDFGLKVDNTITGAVLDEEGNRVSSARVGLIDLDHLPSKAESHVWFDDAYVERDMLFTFVNVPVGRYLLVFNPDGPRPGRLPSDQRFESTYYPLRSARADAKTIEVKSNGVHLTGMDLVVGRRVEFRRVVVRVNFPDGAQMKTAEIVCIGLPAQEGDFLWVKRDFVSLSKASDGSVEFLAPANRALRLEVRDAYGRALKRSYTSTHEPGLTTITQEFVVTP